MKSSPGQRSAHLEVGYVAGMHGLKGELTVRTHDPESDVLAQVTRIWLKSPGGEENELAIVSSRRKADDWLLGLSGVRSREGAEKWKRASVSVYRTDLAPPRESAGEFFQGDLVGLLAVDPSDAPLGQVEAIWNTGPVPNLVIRLTDGKELIVPFVDDFVPRVDLEAGRVVVRPYELVE